MKWGFFKLDKSRWIIFSVIFLLFPLSAGYSSGPCQFFQPPGPAEYLCHVTKPAFLFIPLALIDHFFYRYVTIQNIISSILIDAVFSFILSYLSNLLYKKFFKKSSK